MQQKVVPSSWDPQLHRLVGPGATLPVPATGSERPLRRGRILSARRRRAARQPWAAAPPQPGAQSVASHGRAPEEEPNAPRTVWTQQGSARTQRTRSALRTPL